MIELHNIYPWKFVLPGPFRILRLYLRTCCARMIEIGMKIIVTSVDLIKCLKQIK